MLGGDVAWRFLIPRETAVLVFQQQTQNINTLKQSLGVEILVSGPSDPPRSITDRVLTLKGNSNSKRAALVELLSRMRQSQNLTPDAIGPLLILIPASAIGRIVYAAHQIGPRIGVTIDIRHLISDLNNMQAVAVNGTANQIPMGVQQLNEIVLSMFIQGQLHESELPLPNELSNSGQGFSGPVLTGPTGGVSTGFSTMIPGPGYGGGGGGGYNSVGPMDCGDGTIMHLIRVPPQTESKFVVKFLCGTDKAGCIVGKGGATVKSLEQLSGCSIQIVQGTSKETSDCPSGHPEMEKCICIEGPTIGSKISAILAVLEVLKIKQMESNSQFGGANSSAPPFRMFIPDHSVKFVIGKTGSTIQEICRLTGAMVQVEKPNSIPQGRTDRLVEITGDYDSRIKAAVLVYTRIEEFENPIIQQNKSGGPPAVSSLSQPDTDVPRYLEEDPRSQLKKAAVLLACPLTAESHDTFSMHLLLPREQVAWLLEADRWSDVSQRSNCQITVGADSDSYTERVLSLTGTPLQNCAAFLLIHEKFLQSNSLSNTSGSIHPLPQYY
eukprot:GHVL01018532.1.p1 GENE.GHVL01018532.1~~GHVL01018532.1.p1  ORF type:complete len:552 (+),score=96.78 GHVL01018532.1:28-1683(+)